MMINTLFATQLAAMAQLLAFGERLGVAGYTETAAEETDARTTVTRAVRAAYRAAKDGGFGDDNITGIAQIF